MQDRGAGRGALGSAERNRGVNLAGLLKFFQDLGGSGHDKRVGLLAVWFDKEFVQLAAASFNHLLFSNISGELRISDEREIDEEGLAS